MYKDKLFTKKMISWQCTIVKFRNGLLGLAINDKVSDDDYDGDEVFMVYDNKEKRFIGCKRLCCYDNNLRNILSLNGIIDMIKSVEDGKKSTEILNNRDELKDSEWDIVGVNVYPYAINAFKILTDDNELNCWLYNINN